MLMRQSVIYFFARGIPGVITFISISWYTRLLSPEVYGQYTLLVAWVMLGSAVFFQWLRLGVGRYASSYGGSAVRFGTTITVAFLLLVGATGLIGILLAFIFWDDHGELYLLGVVLLWTQSSYDLMLELARANIQPLRFGKLALTKSFLVLAGSVGLILLGWGIYGLLAGMILGMLVPVMAIHIKKLKGFRLEHIDSGLLKLLLAYGLPLTVTFALEFVINSMDRILLGALSGKETAGIYAVGYDLAKQSLGVLLMVVNLAAFPLAVQAMKEGGEESAKRQLSENGTYFLLIAVPAAVGFAMLAPNIVQVFLGSPFRAGAVQVIPWIALSTLLVGIKTYHFDRGFQLKKSTKYQIWVALASAGTNFLLNLKWIPQFGLVGAAYATAAAYLVALAMSIGLGRRVLAVPFPFRESLKVFASTLLMALVVWPLLPLHGAFALLLQVSSGMLVYLVSAIGLNAAGLKGKAKKSVGLLKSKLSKVVRHAG